MPGQEVSHRPARRGGPVEAPGEIRGALHMCIDEVTVDKCCSTLVVYSPCPTNTPYSLFPMFLDEGTRQFVQALEHSKIPFGIISNGSHRQISKIEALGLHRLTTCIFISDLFGCQKPEPAIFLAAAACLKTPTEKILFVGDDPHLDIYGAHRVGMRTAWIQRGQPWPSTLANLSADMTIHSLGELYPIPSQTLEGRS